MLKKKEFNFFKSHYFYLIVYLIGVVHWVLFLNYGKIGYDYEDWSFYFQLYSTYKESLTRLQIPYHVTFFSGENIDAASYITQGRFFASPWTILSPQIFLLFFIDVKTFITLQYIFFYSLQFYGILKFKKEFNFSVFATVLIIILLSFNGKLLSVSAFGNPQMTFGYMLIPLFFWVLYRFLKKNFLTKKDIIKGALKIALIFFFILSQTDMHIYYQMSVVAFFIVLFFPNKIFAFISGIFLSIISSLWYFLPVLLYSRQTSVVNSYSVDHWRRFGINGYGSQNGVVGKQIFEEMYFNINEFFSFCLNVLKAGINIIGHLYESLVQSFTIIDYNTHDYNLYISLYGLIVLVLSMSKVKIDNFNFLKENYYKIIFSFILIFLISVGPIHKSIIIFVNKFFLFIPIDAVPSRFMIYVFNFVVLLAGFGFDRLFVKLKSYSVYAKMLILSSLLIVLFNHSYDWWITNSRKNHLSGGNINELIFYELSGDNQYINLVNISYLLTFVFLSLSLWFYYSLKKR